MNLKNPAIKMLSRWLDRDAKSHRERSRRHLRNALRVESLESRKLLTTAMMDGDWNDPSIWSEGVPTEETRAIIGHGVTVELSSDRHEAKELVVHGDLVVPEEASFPDKRLKANWVHVNSGGQFIVGTAENRYDEGDFTLELTGTDKYATHLVPTNMGGNMPGTMEVRNNDGFLMTGMMGRVQFYGEEKISFTKLAATAGPSDLTITVASVIERNFNEGDMVDGAFVTSAEDDGEFNWEVGDQIVIASSSYDYREQEVRLIENIEGTGDTRTLTLDAPLQFRHYGEKEIYGDPDNAEPGTQPASESYEIDMRAEVALLSRNIKIQGSAEQDTDLEFGDRWHIVTPEHVSGDETHVSGGTFTTEDINVVDRIPATDLTPNEIDQLPDRQAEIGVGGHVMFMHDSAQDIVVDGVQLDRLGQASQKGRYPIHWHLGGDRTGDILRNSSVTNSNNRGVTIHGTDNLLIEGVVLHDIHGHGFFFEDAVETGNTLIGNLVIGVHAVGGDDDSFANPGQTDPFIVDTHDSFRETNARFSASAAYWITNPDNTFVGNIAAGAGDSRFTDTEDKVRDWADPGPAGTGFWFALPRTAIGLSSKGDLGEANQAVRPIFADLRQFDYNTSHTTAIGLNFDRGSDIEDGSFYTDVNLDSIQPANEYEPRSDASDPNSVIKNTILGFTNYKASEAAMYHRGKAETVQFDGLRIADSANGPWAVSENIYTNSLFVGHSKDNAQFEVSVGGPRLYDGSGLYTNTHFAGFGAENAYTFQVEGSSFGPTMYHAFLSTSFEKDGTYQNLAHAVSDFTDNPDGHNLGQPSQWTKAVMDFDGSLTGAAGGGVGYSIVPSVDFLIDADDTRLPDWDAYLTDDIYARLRIQNLDDGEALFPPGDTGEPLVRYTSADGDIIDAMGGHEINQQFYWTQIATKADSNNDGIVEDTLTVEFMRNGVPANGFALNMTNQDGGRPALSPEIESKVTQSRLVTKFIGAQNYTPSLGQEVMTEAALREVHSGVAFYRDGLGNLYLNTSIVDQPWITLVPGEALQTHFPEAIPTIGRGTVLEAEHFDVGMEGIAYHDSDSVNSQGSFRTDTGVDATESGITDIEDGEWLEYTANVDGDGYSVGFQVASTVAGGQIHISAAPSNSAGFLRHLGTVDIPDTAGDFQAVWHDGIDLNFVDGDAAVLRFTFSGGGFDLDSIEFDEPIQSAYVNRVVAAAGTTRIELEEFDVGGEGIAYSDMTIGNQASSAFRTDENVDTNGDIITNDIEAGEWLEYTTDIEAGVYDITLHKSWGAPGKQVRLLIADQNSATEFEELGVFESTTGDGGENIVLPAVSLSAWAGTERVIRVEMLSSSFGINWLDFAFTNTAQTAYVDRTIAAGSPTVVELEQFDLGGEGIAYSDSSPGNNASDTFRADEDVDTNGSLLTNDVVDGEWLEYTTNIEAGQYDITLNKNWSAGDAAVKLLVGASNSSSELSELGQFEFGAGGQENITLSEIDLSDHAGVERVIRIEVIGSWMGLDSLIFTPAEADSEPPTADIVDVSPDPRNSNAGLVTILFDEEVSGVDLSDFRLTRDGEAVDLSNAVLTPVSGSEYQVDLSAATDADGLYVLTLENQGSGIADLAGNALAANAVDEFLVDLSGPQVESVVVNDGSVQRSMVSKLTVTFSEEVVGLDASSFVLINTTTNAQITPIIDTHVISGRTVATLTFAGDGIIGGSLADGNYTLTTLSSALTDSAGNHLDGDEDGESGGDATDEFFRLFGDGNGDRRVNIIDFFGFRRAIRGEYNAAYDFDGDGRVNIIDFFRFRSRFGKSL